MSRGSFSTGPEVLGIHTLSQYKQLDNISRVQRIRFTGKMYVVRQFLKKGKKRLLNFSGSSFYNSVLVRNY